MGSYQPELWFNHLPESPPFSQLKPIALLEYNKHESLLVSNYFSGILD